MRRANDPECFESRSIPEKVTTESFNFLPGLNWQIQTVRSITAI